MPGTILDLHVHTTVGSRDSRLTPEVLREEARALDAFDGFALTEHSARWTTDELQMLAGSARVVVNAREVETEYGHITVIGVGDDLLRGAGSVAALREIVDAAGGAMISAHPFRYFPGPWSLLFPWSRAWGAGTHENTFDPEELAQHPVFALVDAIETLNVGSTLDQNRWAFDVARVLGIPTVGGSDAHGSRFLGRHATRFPDDIDDEAGLIAAIHAGRCEAVWRHEDEYHPADTLFRLD